MKPVTKQFGVWQEDSWSLYDKLEDAITDHGDGSKIFLITAEYLGPYELVPTLIKRRTRKKKNKKVKK